MEPVFHRIVARLVCSCLPHGLGLALAKPLSKLPGLFGLILSLAVTLLSILLGPWMKVGILICNFKYFDFDSLCIRLLFSCRCD